MIISLCFTFDQQFGTICCPSKNDICLIFSENKYSLSLLFQEFIELRTKTNLSQINSKSSSSIAMNCVLYNQEPFALVQNMRSYFKCNPPDCRIISQDNSELMIHKELLYQTNFLCEMVRSVDIENSNIDILCPDMTKQEIQILIRFLYTGEISCQDQIVASEVSSNLTKFFGFPTIYQCSTTSIQDSNFVSLSEQNVSRKKQSLHPGPNLKHDFAEETYDIKTEYEVDVINNLKEEHELEQGW